MKRFITMVSVAFLIITISACSGSSPKELFETARFEELQNNRQHAAELYEEIIKKYPESEYAQKAREHLSALKQGK